MNTNLYNLLGVENNACESVIKKAYKEKILLYHPDKNPNNPEASELFRQITEAYLILSDQKSRQDYDCSLKAASCGLHNSIQGNYIQISEISVSMFVCTK